MKKRIAFVIWSLAGIGGSERVVYDIVRKLDKNLFSSILISFEDGPVKNIYQAQGVKTFCVQKTRKIDFVFIKKIRDILVDEGVEIVNPHHFSPLLYTYISTRCTPIKVVYTEHSRWQLEQLPIVKKIANRIMHADIEAVVAISDQIMGYYTQNLRISSRKLHLIHNGIDIEAFQKTEAGGIRAKLGIGHNEFVVGIVANIRPEKNHKLLVAAFSDLAMSFENIKLVVAGQDFMQGELQAIARQLGVAEKVLFLGKREDIAELLKVFDVFCLPSIYEGLPLTILEAMAAGVPVVGADVLGINEVVMHHANGLLFPSGSKEELAKCLYDLMQDEALRHRLSTAGREYVNSRFSLEAKIGQYEKLFRSM